MIILLRARTVRSNEDTGRPVGDRPHVIRMRRTHTYDGFDHGSPRTTDSIATTLLIAVAIPALVVAASYPVAATQFAAGIVVAAGLLWGSLAAIVRRTRGLFSELDVPGVGTIELRIVPR